MPADSPWFFVFEGVLVVGAIVFYVWLKRRSKQMEEIFKRREAEIEQEYSERTDPLWKRIEQCDFESRRWLELSQDPANTLISQYQQTYLLASIAWAHQADIARAQLEEI